MNTPANHPEFQHRWQALTRQLENVLSMAHQKKPGQTEWLEAISITKHFVDRLAQCDGRAQPEAPAPIRPNPADREAHP